MTDDKLAKLEARIEDLEYWNRYLRYENECIKTELRKVVSQSEYLTEDHRMLCNDHALLSDDFLETRKNHSEDLSGLAVLAGNVANKVFPKLADAYEEIDRALGMDKKEKKGG